MTKMTYVNALTAILNGEEMTAEIRERLTALCASLEKRSSAERKPTKTQVENNAVKQIVLEVLADFDRPVTVSEMVEDERLSQYKTQKVSALLTQLIAVNAVSRTIDKRKSYFSLV